MHRLAGKLRASISLDRYVGKMLVDAYPSSQARKRIAALSRS